MALNRALKSRWRIADEEQRRNAILQARPEDRAQRRNSLDPLRYSTQAPLVMPDLAALDTFTSVNAARKSATCYKSGQIRRPWRSRTPTSCAPRSRRRRRPPRRSTRRSTIPGPRRAISRETTLPLANATLQDLQRHQRRAARGDREAREPGRRRAGARRTTLPDYKP